MYFTEPKRFLLDTTILYEFFISRLIFNFYFMQNKATLINVFRSCLHFINNVHVKIILAFQEPFTCILQSIIPVVLAFVFLSTILHLLIQRFYFFLTSVKSIIQSFKLRVIVFRVLFKWTLIFFIRRRVKQRIAWAISSFRFKGPGDQFGWGQKIDDIVLLVIHLLYQIDGCYYMNGQSRDAEQNSRIMISESEEEHLIIVAHAHQPQDNFVLVFIIFSHLHVLYSSVRDSCSWETEGQAANCQLLRLFLKLQGIQLICLLKVSRSLLSIDQFIFVDQPLRFKFPIGTWELFLNLMLLIHLLLLIVIPPYQFLSIQQMSLIFFLLFIVYKVTQISKLLLLVLSSSYNWLLLLILLSNFIEVKLFFALGAEVIQIFNDPLPDALLMKDMLARQHDGILHIFIANSASQIMEILQLLSFYFLEKSHGCCQLADAIERVDCLFQLRDVVDP